MIWSKKRRKELSVLNNLLIQLITLNMSSHFLERAKQCIEDASKLFHSNMDTGEKSFINFLIEEVNKSEDKNK